VLKGNGGSFAKSRFPRTTDLRQRRELLHIRRATREIDTRESEPMVSR
jgi:hypothetical protein